MRNEPRGKNKGSVHSGAAVSLIIPCYNEEKRLSEEKILRCLEQLGKGAEITLVDDGSTDGTGGILKKIASSNPAVHVVSLERNGGKAEAVRIGMNASVERGDRFTGFCDADFATPPEEVARVFKGIRERADADTAVGTRNSPDSENISRTPLRGALSRVFSVIASFVLKRRISDSQCGAKFFRNSPALKKALSEPFISRWGFDVEIIGRIEAEKDAKKTVEIPLKKWSEKLPSHMNMLSMAKTLVELSRINGDLNGRRSGGGYMYEIVFTVFVRMIPIYVLTYLLAKMLFREGYWVNPDAYYHAGTGDAYMEMGWLPDFPWLKYTVLGESFPNVYLLQHLILGIIRLLIPVSDLATSLKATIVVVAFLQMLSFYLFMRKWKVKYAAIWTFVGITVSSNMMWHTIALKGITFFSIMFPWIIDALWSNNSRRAFWVGWLSTYVYVGFIIMGPLAACRFAGHLIFDGKWKFKTPIMLFAGVAVGMVASPFLPDNLFHIYREIRTVFERPEFIKAGDFFGSEWSIPNRIQLQHFIGGMVLSAIAATAFFMRKSARADNVSGAAFIAVFVFAILPFTGGIKFAQTFAVLASVLVPLIYREPSEFRFAIPKTGIKVKPVLPAVFAFLLLIYSVPFIKARLAETGAHSPTPRAYSALSKLVKSQTAAGKVVIAPWDDFPGLFYFNRDNYYVSGMNNLFLYHNDSVRFVAFYRFFKGEVKDPAKALPPIFDGTDLLIVRLAPRTQGEVKMLNVIAKAPNLFHVTGKQFNGDKIVQRYWRIYKIQKPGGG